MQELTRQTIEAFKRKGFIAQFFENKDDALKYLLENLGDLSVGIGGSMTIEELGWAKEIQSRGETIWHWIKKEPDTLARENLAPAYITSANAISAEGEIVNIDANGNRICATSFGKKKVFVVVGENKIERNLERALWRAKNIAAPKNSKRLNRKTPCAVKGDKCYNCLSPDRICRVTSIISYPITNMELHLIFLSGSYGY